VKLKFNLGCNVEGFAVFDDVVSGYLLQNVTHPHATSRKERQLIKKK